MTPEPNGKAENGESKTPGNEKDTDEPELLTDKIKKEEEELEKIKKKSMNAWGESGENKTFGLLGMIMFTIPRLWRGDCWRKFLVVFNFFMVFLTKVSMVLVPLLLKEVVDAIICDDSKKEDLEASYFIKMFKDDDTGCPSVEETYILIGLYAGCMFLADFLNYIREIPYATMSALAEISIAYDVYDHV